MTPRTDACCDMMRQQIERRCDLHPDPMDCPDCVVVRFRSGRFGLPVRDGMESRASSIIHISFCPWCGTELPKETTLSRSSET